MKQTRRNKLVEPQGRKYRGLLVLSSLLSLILFFSTASRTQASSPYQYEIREFKSDITLEKNTDLTISETIRVNFPDYRHGIFRVIPIFYTADGRTIKAGFEVIGITDEDGNSYKYEKSRLGQSVKLKIGDPDKTVSGLKTYIITYRITKVVQRYDSHDEIYWNITGSDWDTDIIRVDSVVNSSYATITGVDCYAGKFRSTQKFCQKKFEGNSAVFSSTERLGYGRDFTIIVALDKENQLVYPGKAEKFFGLIIDNWGHPLSVIPFGIMFYFWFKKGRDKKYAVGGPYYKPKEQKEIYKPIFAREHLPMVYHPIKGYTPSEVGTIVDERLDIHDIVGEIVELARLKFVKIIKIEKLKFLGKKNDYLFIKLKNQPDGLNGYQADILESLFDKDATSATIKEIENIYKKDNKSLREYLDLATNENLVILSALKNKFYRHLPDIRKKLYKSLEEKEIFDGDPDKVRLKWTGVFIAMDVLAAVLLFSYLDMTGNFVPILSLGVFSIPASFFAISMPRKTAWGYSLYRQIEGLAYYLTKGKWRQEIAEKHLFFEEMLPLAISLEVVDKLAGDMQELGVAPPSYFVGANTATITSDIGNFKSQASSNLISTPGGRGASGWSGGSGFSGGSSGGGFGGGGGGSW